MTAAPQQSGPRDEPRDEGRRHLRREALHIAVTLAALTALLAIAIAAAHFDAGRLAPVIAMSLSAIKALLVALIFMRLTREPGITRLFAAAGLFWLAILFTLTLADYRTRPERGNPSAADHAEARQMPSNRESSDAPAASPEHQ